MSLDISLEINNNNETQMDLEIHLEARASDHQLKIVLSLTGSVRLPTKMHLSHIQDFRNA